MTEYALILATIAVVLISLYNTAGTLLKTLVDQVNPLL
jgi:Flp pilus assembly pilin Flp